MKKAMMILLISEALFASLALAKAPRTETEKALSRFEGTYQLISQNLSQDPRSETAAVCYNQVVVERPQSENCEDCKIDLDIVGLPSGQGLIVVQMTKVNEGPQLTLQENPMFPGPSGTYSTVNEVKGSQLKSQTVARNLLGRVRFSTDFQASLNASTLEFRVRNYRAINGFEDSTAICRYQRLTP